MLCEYCVCMYVCMYVCTYVYMYYIYIYIYIYIYRYIHIYTYTSVPYRTQIYGRVWKSTRRSTRHGTLCALQELSHLPVRRNPVRDNVRHSVELLLTSGFASKRCCRRENLPVFFNTWSVLADTTPAFSTKQRFQEKQQERRKD